jgi:outer membrane receptor protein involved in Fe transport
MLVRIQGIEVGASRTGTTIGGVSAFEATVDSLALPAAATIEELFRRVPAIHVRTNSRGEAEVTVRGSESRQVAILVDGSPIMLGWDARSDVSVIPANAIAEITFVRGLSSVLYGPNTLGGVVDLRVASGAIPARSIVKAEAGFDGEGGYGLTGSGSVPFSGESGTWLIRGGAGFRDSPGVPLAAGVVEPVPGSKPSLRLNTDVHSVDGFAAVRYQANGGAFFSFLGTGFNAERGIAGELGVAAPRLWRYPNISRTLLSASAGTGSRPTPAGHGGLQLTAGLDNGHSEIDAFADRSYERVVSEEDGDAKTTSLRVLAQHSLGPRGELSGAFTWSNIEHRSTIDGNPLDYQQTLLSVGAETTLELVDAPDAALEALRISFGYVFDRGRTPKTGALPSQGAIGVFCSVVVLCAVV